MTRVTDLAFHSPWAFVLVVALPIILINLYQAQRHRYRTQAFDEKTRALTKRSINVLLLLSVVALVVGLSLGFWVVVATDEHLTQSPLIYTGVTFLALAVLMTTVAMWLQKQNQPAFLISSISGLAAISQGRPSVLRLMVPFFRLLAISGLLLALARPQIASTDSDIYTEGMDIVITLDVSTSMEAVDFAPKNKRGRLSRIEGAREVIGRFVQQRAQDRLGLVVFAAEAFTQCPLSLDYSILTNILRTLKTGVIEDGTAIGNAIMVSINRLRDSDAKSKAIILLTDGDDNASKVSPAQAAEIASSLDIHIFPILVGKGGKVPYPVGPNLFGQMQYQNVEIRTDPQLLKTISEIASGKFYRATDKTALEEDFQDILDQMEKTRLMDPGKFTRHTEVFQLALLPALLALLLELALGWTRFRRFP